jgi:signal transduction histidine kinase
MPIVKEIIEAHLGKITVKSKKNVGTTFTIELPLA